MVTEGGSSTAPFDLAGRRVWVAGHRGMVGSAVARRLTETGCQIQTVNHAELDLRDQAGVNDWMAFHRPEVVVLAAARVGGIQAERRQHLQPPAAQPHGQGGRRLRAVPHGRGTVAIGRIAIAQMHAGLVLHRPGQPRHRRPQPRLQGAVCRGIGTRSKPDHVDIAARQPQAAAVQAVPDRLTQRPGGDPGVGQLQPLQGAQHGKAPRGGEHQGGEPAAFGFRRAAGHHPVARRRGCG